MSVHDLASLPDEAGAGDAATARSADITTPARPAGVIRGTGDRTGANVDADGPAGVADSADLAAEAGELLAGMVAAPGGESSPSVYETGRLVALAPGLTGHRERLAFLVAAQRPAGGWGPHERYALAPTLSATDALLAELARGVVPPQGDRAREPGTAPAVLAASAARGLHALFRWSRQSYGVPLPDMPAVELIVPSLIDSINRHLLRLAETPVDGLRTWSGVPPLPLPPGMDGARLEAIRSLLRSGAPLPVKLLHFLEVAGDAAFQAPAVQPSRAGGVGASPAATAAWLGHLAAPDHAWAGDARLHLRAAVETGGGPVPCALPITVFERGWVLSWLLRAGVPCHGAGRAGREPARRDRPGGAAAGPGLPEDADTTSVALYALALPGLPAEPRTLWEFDTGQHFSTWQGEQGFSTTVNAHVLDAFGQYAELRPAARPGYGEVMERLAGWLRGRQEADGSWSDRWHASPYYATVCCAPALDRFGGPDSAPAVRRAVRWVLSTQRSDGSWGLWRGTAEETAYAMQVLLLAGGSDPAIPPRVALGYAYLMGADRPGRPGAPAADPGDHPPMWHDKDLYLPGAIVRAAIVGALHLARSHPSLT